MKSNIEKVYSKLPKTELAKVELEAQKFELSSISLLNDIAKEANKIYNRGVSFVNDRDALTKEAQVLNINATQIFKGAEKVLNDFVSKAKELGIDPRTIPEFKKANEVLGPVDTVISQTKGYTKTRS
jgi:hypothetical protein